MAYLLPSGNLVAATSLADLQLNKNKTTDKVKIRPFILWNKDVDDI